MQKSAGPGRARADDKYSPTILIDGFDILRIGLKELKSKVDILPQNPFSNKETTLWVIRLTGAAGFIKVNICSPSIQESHTNDEKHSSPTRNCNVADQNSEVLPSCVQQQDNNN
eukprot:scaffold1485_cov171-Amphora_coffeaeformis.AAC.7